MAVIIWGFFVAGSTDQLHSGGGRAAMAPWAPASCGVGRRRQRRSQWHGDSGNRRRKGEEKGRRPAVFIEGEASVRAMHDTNLRKDDTGSRCAACGSSAAALPQRRVWAESVPIDGRVGQRRRGKERPGRG